MRGVGRVCWKYSKRNMVGHVFITVNIHNDTPLSEVLTRNSISRTFVNWVREHSVSLKTKKSVPLGVLPAWKIKHGHSETRVWQEDAYHMPHIPCLINIVLGARCGAVGWGAAFQAGRSRVRSPMASLEFFIGSPFGRTMALGLTQPLTEMSTKNISCGVKAAGA